MAYDIELKPKVVQTGDLEKLEKQIDAISNKSITLDVQVDSHGKSAKTIGELIDQASRVKTELESMTKTIKVDVNINDVENRVHDMLAKLSQLSRYNGKDVSIGLRLGAANESALKPNQIDRLIGQAEKIQTLRSGKKNLALSVDTSQIGNQIDETLNLIQEKFATATTSINTSAVTSGIDEGAKRAGLSLKIDTPIDTGNLKALLDQVDRIVALSPDTIEKKVSLEVNSGEFLNQMKEAMAKLEAIDPELVNNRKATLNQYNDLYEEYTKERKEFQNSLNSFEEMDIAPGTKEFSKKLEKIQNQASALYNTMQKLENLLGKNEFLYGQPNLPGFTDKEVIEPLEKLKSNLITVAEIELEDADKLASFKEQLQNLEITKKPVKDLDEELKNMATSINGTNTAARGSLEIINAINSAISKLATRMGALVKASETMRSGLGEATRNLNITLGTLAEYLKDTQAKGVTPINNALDTTAQKTEEINSKFANLDNSLERLSKAYATLKSPFDLNDFATVNRLLGGFQSKLEELVTNYSDTKIKLTIESNDALQSLNDAANNVKKMVEAQKVFEKWLGKYQGKHPISEDTYANIGGTQTVADALSKYNQIINGEKKEVSLQFNTVGLDEVISDYDHIKNKNVEIRFALSNAEAVGNTIDNLRNANVEVNQGGGISISLDEGALSSVNTNIANVINKLEEIRTLLPTLKLETKQGEDNDTPDLLTPLEEIRSRIQSIDSKILAADTSNTGDKSSVISQYMSLIDSRLKSLQESLLATQNINGDDTSNENNQSPNTTQIISMLEVIEQNTIQMISDLNSLGGYLETITNKPEPENKSEPILSQIRDTITDLNSKITSKDNAANEIDGHTKIVSAINEGVKSLQSELVKTPTSIDNVNNSINTKSDKIITLLDTISKKRGSIGGDESKNKKDKISAPNAQTLISNLTQAANIKSSVDTRVKELQRVLSIMDGGVSSDIFGSRQDIEAYITSLKTLNGEIASATKILNRANVSSAQQKEAQNKITTNTRAINGIINGNYHLGISPAKIKNINTLLESMATINERIGSADPALQGLSKLKETLEKYGVEIQPLNDAVTALKSNRERMDQLIQSLNNPNLRTTELNKIRAELETNQADFQALIENAKSMLNREQKDSLSSISADFVEAEKEIDKYKTKIDSLKSFLSSLTKKGQDLSAFDMGNGKSAKDLQTFINTYEQFINSRGNLNDAANMQAFANNFRTNYQQPLDQYIATLSDANRRWNELNASAANSMQALSFDKRLADFSTKVEKWKNNYSNALKDADLSEAFNKIYSQLANGAVTTDEQLKKLQADLAQLTFRANQAGVASKNLTTKLKEMFKKYGGWTLVTRTLNYTMRLLRSMVTQVKEVDTAMTNLRKVTEATGRQLNDFLKSAGKRSVSLGASLTDYVDAVSEFSRLGKKLDEAQKLGELATMYKTVAEDLDIKTASQSLISTMQAFSQAGVQAEEIVDKFNYVGNNFAASSADIGVALQKSASALYGAQNTLSESVALITAGNEIVQNAEIIGTQLKTISARIRGTKDELGEDADDLVITTSKLRKELKALTGVDIMEND